nr:hypothetical protein [Pseudomonadota bacterium]
MELLQKQLSAKSLSSPALGREINSSFLSAEENNLEETSVASSNIQKEFLGVWSWNSKGDGPGTDGV